MSVPDPLVRVLAEIPDAPELEMFFWKRLPYAPGDPSAFVSYPRRIGKHVLNSFIEIPSLMSGTWKGKPFQVGYDEPNRVAVLWMDQP